MSVAAWVAFGVLSALLLAAIGICVYLFYTLDRVFRR